MRRSTIWVLFVALIIGLLAASYWKYFLGGQQTPPEMLAERSERHPVPAARYPVPASESAAELPDLGKSDPAIREVLAGQAGGQDLNRILFLDHFIERFVLMIDNLPKRELPVNRLPTRPARGKFTTAGEEGNETIAAENERRYRPYIRFAEALDSGKLVTAYLRLYPLFQEAYVKMGYPDAHFNDRLIEVIDHLIAAPVVRGPIRLERHALQYRFADPELEALSAGQKIMVRIGSANSAALKEKLREIRGELTSRSMN